MLSAVFLASLLAGLLLAVRAMLVGVERPRPGGELRPGISVPAVAAFATAFGLVGYVLLRYAAVSSVVAIVGAVVAGGLATAGAIVLVAKWAVSPPAEDDDHDHHHHGNAEWYELQGTPATVTRAISAEGEGEIEYEGVGGARHATPARSFDGTPLDAGAEVVIDRIEDGVAYVEAWAAVEKRL